MVFQILFGAIFTVAVSVALGRLFLNRLALPLGRAEHWLFSFVTGAALLNLLVFALATVHQARTWAFVGCGVVILALAAWRRDEFRRGGQECPRHISVAIFFVVLATFGWVYFCHAMAPEFSPDGAEYHLGTVSHYWRNHGFVRLPNVLYASLSQGTEMLFLHAFAFGRHSAAALVHFSFLLALPLLMVCYGQRFGFAKAGMFGGLLVFLSPIFGIDGSSAYNDVALASVVFSLFYLLQIWDETRQRGLLAAAGVLAGFCYAIKYTAFVAVIYAVAFVGWRLWRGHKRMLGPLAVMCGCAAILILPWMLRNWILYANPVAPFFNSLFPNPYIHIAFEKQYFDRMQHFSGLAAPHLPMEWTVLGTHVGGLLGPVFLLAPLGLLALRTAAGRQLLLAGTIFALPVLSNDGVRFLIPAAPFFALAMGLAIANTWGALPVLAAAHAVLSWPSVVPVYCGPYAWRLGEQVPVAAAFRKIPEQEFLRSRLWFYRMMEWIEEEVPPGGMVYTYAGLPEAYTARRVVVFYESAFAERLKEVLWTPVDNNFTPALRMWLRFPAQPVRRLRVVWTEGGPPEFWAVNEMRIFHGTRELERQGDWRLRAQPESWDVQRAFDNSYVTRWRTWQPLAAGMHLEVEFPRTEVADAVSLDCTPEMARMSLTLDAQLPDGSWRTVAPKAEPGELPPPANLRRRAMLELKAQGVTHLVIRDSDPGAADMRQDSSLWGITELRSWHDTRLYRID